MSPDWTTDGASYAITSEDGRLYKMERDRTSWIEVALEPGQEHWTGAIAFSPLTAHDETIFAGTDAGTVVVEVAAGLSAYEGTIRHGIASTSYAAWSLSYRFPDAPEDAEPAPGETVFFDQTGDWVTPPNRIPATTCQGPISLAS